MVPAAEAECAAGISGLRCASGGSEGPVSFIRIHVALKSYR